MAKTKPFEFETDRVAGPSEEDQSTLAAIDEGIADTECGRTLSAEEVRKRLTQWITIFSSRKGR